MEVANAYKEKPVVPYAKTAVQPADVIAFIKGLPYETEVKRTVYAVAFNETAGFTALVNTNAAGIQADEGRWHHQWDAFITATTVKSENMTGHARRFLVFNNWQSSLKMLAHYMQLRGIYVGGNCGDWAGYNPVKGKEPNGLMFDLYVSYLRAWVYGQMSVDINTGAMKNFTLLYNRAAQIFA